MAEEETKPRTFGAGSGYGSGGAKTPESETSTKKQSNPSMEAIKQIEHTVKTLQDWRDSEDITSSEKDSAVLAIGKLEGAVVKLNRK